jgi:sugar O-acyltransferase (sialic acid O-acetyltransferase NeuD family)
MTLKETILFGYSGHALVAANCLSTKHVVVGYFDAIENDKNPMNIAHLGDENEFQFSSLKVGTYVFPAIGDNHVRQKIREFFIENGLNETKAIHERAYVAESASIGLSTMVGPNAIINDLATIGNGVIINSGAIVEHECILDDYVHIAPGAVLAGNVSIGRSSFIGANSVIKEGVSIGKNAIIGAGSVVLCDIPDNELWVGSPAQKKK